MRYRSLLTTFFASLLLLVGPPITVQALPGSGSASGSAEPCHPGTPPWAPPTETWFDPSRKYLGPEPLPQTPPVSPLLVGYQRLGNLSEDQFVAKYRKPDDSGWIYPPDDGFVIVADNTAAHTEVLLPGTRVDRFGNPSGKFLSPVGTPFSQRAIPPANLTTYPMTPQANYHVYCVLATFRVQAGPAQPWFEQPGYGKQYVLDTSFQPFPEGADGAHASVQWMIDNHLLVEEIPN
ncbi:TNT domain-containing protein [Nocardia sp. NPDC059764]|uniref:TNT domain-containing protein n=1 Tax=Nocardia sp. NPDC059764 TaxID=3346939 RepID=UPI003661CF08